MYIDKFPRTGLTPNQMCAVSDYFDWEEHNKKKPNEACTFEEWVGEDRAKALVGEPIRELLRPYISTTYLAWDVEKNYPNTSISTNVAYWRKANAIHQYFVDMVQDGEDDCDFHNEITREILLDLLDKCMQIKRKCPLENGKVANGYRFDNNGNKIYDYVDGKVMTNIEIADELLPSQEGFFFGSTDYDEYYMNDIDDTINQITKILTETDFEKEVLYYVSSW